jgi:outer membrane protein OmpA-like peptidoglycan-associated protein
MFIKLFFAFYVLTLHLPTSAQFNVYFSYNQYHITPEQQFLLDSFLTNTKNIQLITIKGFADTTGTLSYNLTLSQKRASAVEKYIHKKYKLKITTSYVGETNEASTDYLNRKVELTALQKQVHFNEKIIERITFNKIFFIPSTATIKQESFPDLDELCKKIIQLKNKKLEIRGHINWLNPTDTIPTQYKTLSYERAIAVYNYVKAKGVDVSKVSYKGMSTTEMIYPYPKSLYEQEQNMRVEIVVLE